MKKRNKKYNPDKYYQADPASLVKDIAIFQLPEHKCNFVNTKTMSLIMAPKGHTLTPLAKVFTQAKFNWTIAIIVFRITDKGEKAIDVQHLCPPVACKADDVSDAVKEKHEAMMHKTPDAEFLCGGWLASPTEVYHSSVKLVELFDKMGVWDNYITNNGNKLE